MTCKSSGGPGLGLPHLHPGPRVIFRPQPLSTHRQITPSSEPTPQPTPPTLPLWDLLPQVQALAIADKTGTGSGLWAGGFGGLRGEGGSGWSKGRKLSIWERDKVLGA